MQQSYKAAIAPSLKAPKFWWFLSAIVSVLCFCWRKTKNTLKTRQVLEMLHLTVFLYGNLLVYGFSQCNLYALIRLITKQRSIFDKRFYIHETSSSTLCHHCDTLVYCDKLPVMTVKGFPCKSKNQMR